ncbi:MAG: haloacid dehalogenase type II [Acidobacteria bacterium]|nr:haloacid dehalogenase type II [Acidobacteriota bacterium]
MVKAVVFDAYGTLFDIGSLAGACAAVTPETQSFCDLWRQKQLEYTFLVTVLGRYRDFWQITSHALSFALKKHDVKIGASEKQRLLESYLTLPSYDHTEPTLQRLEPFRLAILSNGTPAMLGAVVRHNNLTGYFSHVLSADRVRLYKPHPEVYRLAVDALGVQAADVLFISSNSFDVVGAGSFGFRVAWINRSRAPLDELGIRPDHELQSLVDLPALIA